MELDDHGLGQVDVKDEAEGDFEVREEVLDSFGQEKTIESSSLKFRGKE